MKSDIFGFLSSNFMKQRIFDSLLLFLSKSIILFSIYPFIFNFFIPSFKVLAAAVFIIFLHETAEWIRLRMNREMQMKILNLLNPDARNIILASYEASLRKEDSNSKREMILEIENYPKEKIIYFSALERISHVRILFISVIILLLVFLLYPVFFSNMLSLTEKSAVIEFVGSRIEITGYNLGSISGHLMAVEDNVQKKFEYKRKYEDNDEIYFSGPAVKSNSLLYKNIKEVRYDSLMVIVKPSPYQKKKEYSEKTQTVFAPEYSDITAVIYVEGGEDTFFRSKKTIENNSVNIFKNKAEKFVVNVIKDSHPAVKILSDEKSLRNKEKILIPCAYADDYGIERVGLILKTEAESIDFIFEKTSDSITWFEADLSSLKGNSGYVKAYVKDNNPFRTQVGYSQEIIFDRELNIFEIIEEIDSNSVFSGFAERADELISELNERKENIMKDNIQSALKQYEENLKEIQDALNEVRRNAEKTSENSLPDEIMKQMYEIKKQIDKIESEVLEKIAEKLSKMNKTDIKREAAMDMIKKDAKEIEESLKQLEKMLEQLNKLGELKEFQADLEQIEQMQDSVSMKKENKGQENVTEKIEKQIEKNKESSNLQEWQDDMESLKGMSKEAEKDSKKAEDVKKKLEEMKKELQSEMNKMTNAPQYDKNLAILSLLSMNEMITDKSQAKIFYANLLDFTKSADDPKNPLFLHIQKAVNIAEDEFSSLNELKNQNYIIISFMLKKNPASGSGMSMEQMMENLSSLSEEQKTLSQTLWDMFNEQNFNKDMLKEMARYQSEIARKLKELSEGKDGEAGLKELSDSLTDVAEEISKQNVNEDLLKKQDRMLNKMLKLVKSLYKQGITEKRESKTGKEYNDAVKRVIPEDYGYKKSAIESMFMEFIKDYKDDAKEYYLKKYYMEILK